MKKGWGFQIAARNIAVPLGISFYTLQALGYMIDVYRGTIPAEKNLGKLGRRSVLRLFPTDYGRTDLSLW